MKIGIMQPYFMPYIGYFQLMGAVDKYVVYDDVNYIKGGWASRNNILINGEKKMFTIVLKGASPNKRFNEIEIGDDFHKLMRTLEMNYSKASHFQDIMNLLHIIISYSERQLAKFLANSYKEILKYLNIQTEIIISSDLQKNDLLKGKDKVIHICKLLGADTYYNAIGGQELYDKNEFEENGIQIKFLKTSIIQYPQLAKNFIPGLSIIDVLMNNSIENANNLLNKYNLI